MLIGKKAPNFNANCVFKDQIKNIKLSDYENKYVVLFFYPLDFTFVCPTELHSLQEKLPQFKEKNVEILGCSVDSEFSHLAWLNQPKSTGGIQGIEYGLISDLGQNIAKAYDILNENVAYRAFFVIDKTQIIRNITINDLPIGRNIDEILRIIDALQFHEKNGLVCPANWKKGENGMETNQNGLNDYFKK